MRTLALEFAKLHRKHVWLIVLAMVAATLVWVYVGARQEGAGSPSGWQSMLYSAPLMNSIFLSLLAAVVASRVADVDHEADAWKELLCLQRTAPLLAGKLACAALIMLCATALETAGIMVIGQAMGFPDMPGASTWAVFLLSQLASCLGIVAIVGSIALRWENQFVSIATGLALSLAGLFSSFLLAVLQRLVPSGYFTLLSCTRIDWRASTSAPVFYEMAFSWGDLMLLAAISAVFISWSFISFSRREH